MGGGALNFGGTAGRPPPPNAPPAHLAGSMSGVLKSSYRTREPCAWAGTLTSAVPQRARATPPRTTIISVRENARRGKLFKAATLIPNDGSGTTFLYLCQIRLQAERWPLRERECGSARALSTAKIPACAPRRTGPR